MVVYNIKNTINYYVYFTQKYEKQIISCVKSFENKNDMKNFIEATEFRILLEYTTHKSKINKSQQRKSQLKFDIGINWKKSKKYLKH